MKIIRCPRRFDDLYALYVYISIYIYVDIKTEWVFFWLIACLIRRWNWQLYFILCLIEDWLRDIEIHLVI